MRLRGKGLFWGRGSGVVVAGVEGGVKVAFRGRQWYKRWCRSGPAPKHGGASGRFASEKAPLGGGKPSDTSPNEAPLVPHRGQPTARKKHLCRQGAGEFEGCAGGKGWQANLRANARYTWGTPKWGGFFCTD